MSGLNRSTAKRPPHRMRVTDTAMTWILLGTGLVYLVANAPLIYSLLAVHRPNGIIRLWGYAPNQFLFLVVFFPLATFAALAALRGLVFKAAPTLPISGPLREVIRHWPVAILVAIIIAALVSIIVYFGSAWSLDKLEAAYADRAVNAMESVRAKVELSSSQAEQRETTRISLIAAAKAELAGSTVPSGDNKREVADWLKSLSDGAYLQAVQRPDLQVRLHLLNPILHALNVLQLFASLFVGMITLSLAVVGFVLARSVGLDGQNFPELGAVLWTVVWAVFFFGMHALCYGQYRTQMEYVVGSGTTVLQDLFLALVVFVVLVALVTVDPANRQFSFDTVVKFLPAIILGSGTATGLISPPAMRQLIGSDTTVWIQAILILVVLLLAGFPVVQVWPKD